MEAGQAESRVTLIRHGLKPKEKSLSGKKDRLRLRPAELTAKGFCPVLFRGLLGLKSFRVTRVCRIWPVNGKPERGYD
jgi:hypothetical protein